MDAPVADLDSVPAGHRPGAELSRSGPPTDPDTAAEAHWKIVRRYIARYDRRKRQLAVVRALGRAAGAGLLWIILWCLLDRWLRLPTVIRAAALMAGIVIVAWIILRAAVRALLHRGEWIAIAADIERRRPQFGQRLLTAVSQAVFPPAHRASDAMIEALLHDVAGEVRPLRATRLLPWRRAARPWVTAIIIAAGAAALTQLSWLQMPTLAMRLLNPAAAIPPVTTTRLTVSPGDISIIQGQGVEIVAEVQRLIGSSVELSVSHDGRNFSSIDMPRAPAADRYAFAFASLDRDMSYEVSAGDAASRRYLVRVLRRPAVSEFRIRYEYPAYTGKPPIEVVNADGFVEALIGTRVTLSFRSTEPLRQAQLTLGDSPLTPVASDEDAALWRASFPIERDARYTLEMTSAAGVGGSGPGQMFIRAIPDRPPAVKLALTAEDLRYHPRDVVEIPFVAGDDYGLAELRLEVQTNSAPAAQTPIELPSQVRRHEDIFEFDLAPLKLAIGDVVSFNLVATDHAGQKTVTEMRHALIAPRSIDLNTHLRLGELRYAMRLGQMLVSEIESAQSADAQGRSASAQHPESWMVASARSRLNQHAVTASETTTLLRLTLLRVILRSASASMSDGLANLLDATQPPARLADDVARLRDQPQPLEQRLADALQQAGALVGQLKMLFDGQQAMVVLADRENLSATPSTSPADERAQRQAESAARAAQDIERGARQIGLDPRAADLDEQLRSRVAAADQWIAAQAPVDFVAVARAWAGENAPRDLTERLGMAAQAEAVRPDANLVRARDLQLASRAAGAIDRDENAEARRDFPGALSAMDAEHRAQRANESPVPARGVDPAVAQAAEAARLRMAVWAGDRDAALVAVASTAPAASAQMDNGDSAEAIAPTTQPSAQELAMAASAEAASRNYERAAELDRRLASRRSSIQGEEEWENQLRVQRAMSAAKQIDELNAEQEKIRDAVSQAPAEQLPAIAQRQQELAATIRQVREEQSELRGEAGAGAQAERASTAIATLTQLRRQLDAMPAQLATVRQTAEPLSAMLAAHQSALAAQKQSATAHAQAVAAHEQATAAQQQMLAAHQQSVAAPDAAASEHASALQLLSAAQAQLDSAMAAAATQPASAPSTSESATQPAAAQVVVDPALTQAVESARQAVEQADAKMKQLAAQVDAQAAQLSAADAALLAAGAQVETTQAQTTAAEQATVAAATALDTARASAGDAAKPVHPDVASAMAQSARALEGMPVDALVQTFDQQLAPPLTNLQNALTSADSSAAAASVDQATAAVDVARKQLDDAVSAVIDRQPLAAAEHFARLAGQSAADVVDDRAIVTQQQQRASESLMTAWDRAIRRASTERLKGLSVMGSLFSLYDGNEPGGAVTAAGNAGAPAAREWGRLPRREDLDLNASLHDDAPAGYQDAIRAYFESLAGGDADGRSETP